MIRPAIHVVAGVLTDAAGRVLIAQRPPGKHLAGGWEFPGGKRDEGESREAALRREFAEELGVEVRAARPLIRYAHDYPEKRVELDVWRITAHRGEPRGLEGQALDWCAPEGLMAHDLLPADKPIVTALTLSPLLVVTGAFADEDDFERRLRGALSVGAGVVQLRVPGTDAHRLRELGAVAAGIVRAEQARLVVNAPPADWPLLRESGLFDGLHLAARHAAACECRPVAADELLGASCHDAAELARAVELGADYAVLGSVRPTASHPGGASLGWERFDELVTPCRLPVYAIGGMARVDLSRAWEAGGQGIAAIGSLWSGHGAGGD
jgi:8-oxo-dGTP diphosphatase